MFKKITALILTLIIFTACFTACSGDKTDKAFACAVAEMPQHFDPQIAKTTGERMIAVNMFDGLFKPSENGELLKCAAEDYSVSADGLVYTFRLREDLAYFVSDSAKKYIEEKGGQLPSAVTAEDFAFGITRAVLPETDAPFYELLSAVKNADKVHNGELSASELGVRAEDSRTLVITLERKSPEFIYALSQPVSFPCNREFFELTDGRYGLQTKYMITNGGFYLASVNKDTSVRIVKNELYKGSFAPVPSSVTFYLNADSADAAEKVDNGNYDCGFFTSPAAVNKLGRKVTVNNFTNTAFSMVFNMRKENMQNNLLRRGLVSSIDTSRFSDGVAGAVPPYYKVAGNMLDSSGAEKLVTDVDKAREDIKAAFDELKVKTLTVELLCTPEYGDIAKSIVSSWQKNIGVELNGVVVAENEADFQKKLKSGEYDAAICPFSVDSDRAADFLAMFVTDNGGNFFGYSSEEYDRLWQELRNYPDASKAVYCQSYLLKNAVVLPLYYENSVFAAAKGVEGIYFCGDSANVYFYKGQK